MISAEFKEVIYTQFRIKKLLWFGLTVGILLYFIAVYFITLNIEPNNNFSNKAENIILYIGIILLILSISLRKYLFSSYFFKHFILSNKTNSKTRNILFNINYINNQTSSLNDFEKKITNYLSRQQIYYIINLGLNDTIGILGIAIGFISKDITKALPYILVAFALNIWIYPNDARLINKIINLKHQYQLK